MLDASWDVSVSWELDPGRSIGSSSWSLRRAVRPRVDKRGRRRRRRDIVCAILSWWLVFSVDVSSVRHVTQGRISGADSTEKLLTGRLRGVAYRFSKRHCPKRRFPGLVVLLRFRVQRERERENYGEFQVASVPLKYHQRRQLCSCLRPFINT